MTRTTVFDRWYSSGAKRTDEINADLLVAAFIIAFSDWIITTHGAPIEDVRDPHAGTVDVFGRPPPAQSPREGTWLQPQEVLLVARLFMPTFPFIK